MIFEWVALAVGALFMSFNISAETYEGVIRSVRKEIPVDLFTILMMAMAIFLKRKSKRVIDSVSDRSKMAPLQDREVGYIEYNIYVHASAQMSVLTMFTALVVSFMIHFGVTDSVLAVSWFTLAMMVSTFSFIASVVGYVYAQQHMSSR